MQIKIERVSFKSKKKSSEEFRKLYFGKQSKVVHFKSWTENRELNLVTSKNREYNNKNLEKLEYTKESVFCQSFNQSRASVIVKKTLFPSGLLCELP